MPTLFFLRLKAMATALALATLASCGSFDLGDKRATEVAVDPENPNFNADIRPLMALKCMSCHADPLPKHAPRRTTKINFADEGTFKKFKQRVWARTVLSAADPMPPEFATPLSSTERLALKKYLSDNGVDTKTQVAATPSPTGGGSSGTQASLSDEFGNLCAGCHGSKGEGAAFKALVDTSLSQAAFLAKVRAGGNGMPTTFTAAKISDATVASDYAKIKASK